MDGWIGGFKSHFKDCLQLSKIFVAQRVLKLYSGMPKSERLDFGERLKPNEMASHSQTFGFQTFGFRTFGLFERSDFVRFLDRSLS